MTTTAHDAANLLPPVHPGEVLGEDFLRPMNLAPDALAGAIGVDVQSIHSIVSGERAITREFALLLSRYFGTSTGFWMGLQAQYNAEMAGDRHAD